MLARARDAIARPTVIVLVLLGILPLIVSDASAQSILVTAMIYATGAVGLDLLTGYSGQFSFGQFVYFAVGAYVMSSLVDHLMVPWPLAMLAGVVAAGLVAALIGAALVRLKFFGLAVGTFFLGAVVFNLLTGDRLAPVTGGSNGLPSPQMAIGDLNLGSGYPLYYTVLIVLAIAALVVVRYTKVRAGIASRVIKENEVVAAVMGIKVFKEKIRVQTVAGLVGGLGGCMLALSLGYLSPDSFNVTQSIELFAIVAVGGQGSIVGPILGAVFFFEAVNGFASNGSASALVFAVVLLLVVIFLNRGLYDLVERVARLIRRAVRRGATSPAVTRELAEAAATTVTSVADTELHPARVRVTMPSDDDVLLTVENVGVDFGGVKALDDVSVTVRRGEVHAIIGPNGAGKTTFLNCISGIQASTGAITLDGQSLAGISVSDRRQRGLARTFQHPSLVADLTVLRNVSIGAYVTQSTSILAELLGLPASRRRHRVALERAAAALRTVEFPEERWGTLAGDATMGEQKHVDIARAISSEPALLLLDEPTAGLGTEEVSAVARAIEAARDAGVTILVIAHHVGFIRQIADRATVLDFGKVLMTGTPEEVLEDQRVIEIFVGTGAKS